jgi:hypothetical protein
LIGLRDGHRPQTTDMPLSNNTNLGCARWQIQGLFCSPWFLRRCWSGVPGAAASFQRALGDLGPGHKSDISLALAEYKSVIKLLVAAAAGCQGTKN